MVAGRQKASPFDTVGARLAGLAIACLAAGLMFWIGRDEVPLIRGLMPGAAGSGGEQTASSGNPELDACLASRIGDVDAMRRDGVISNDQYDLFRARATAYCETQFPGK